MWLFLAFLLVPLIEIALFIQVGGWIGLWPTLAIVVLTAMAGTMLVRSQGAQALAQLRRSFETLHDPTIAAGPRRHDPVFRGAVVDAGVFHRRGGICALGAAACGISFSERSRNGLKVAELSVTDHPHGAPRPADDVIDASYTVQDDARPSRGPSGWTQR